MKHARAELCWIPAEAGGRSRAPSSPYTTVAKFAGAAATEQQWSLVCTFEERAECVPARVHFLSKDAPHHLLRPGATFALCEGEKVVARGAVEGVAVPEVSER